MNERSLSIPGFTIAAKTWGNSDKPPILALHGWLDNANSFAPIAELLQDDFYFIAVDLPGHGHSSHLPEGCNYHFIDGIFIVVELIKALQLGPVHLLGHSMGACLGSLVAGVVPEQLLSLYLIEGLGPFSAPEDMACSQLTAFTHFLTKKPRKQSKGYEQFTHTALARSFKGHVSFDIAKILCERSTIEKEGKFYWRHDQRLFAPTPLKMTEPQILSCLQNIQAKSELLLSTNGFTFDPKLMKQRIKTVNNLNVKQLDGGHHVHMEQPEVVSQLLADFYKAL